MEGSRNLRVNRVTDSDNAIPTWSEVKDRIFSDISNFHQGISMGLNSSAQVRFRCAIGFLNNSYMDNYGLVIIFNNEAKHALPLSNFGGHIKVQDNLGSDSQMAYVIPTNYGCNLYTMSSSSLNGHIFGIPWVS